MLSGMRVASFCHYLQGPAATQYLADMGADVVKVEAPRGAYERHWSGGPRVFVGDISVFFLSANRNKRSLALDLKSPEGREVALRLIEQSDAVVENFRPGVMDRLGLGYEAIRARKPEIVYASASGFGSTGPLRDQPGQDLLIQARAGLIAATGALRPTPVGNAAVDQHGAALLAMGVIGAYVRRLKTGEGTRVEASLFNAGIDLQNEPLALYFSGRGGQEQFERDPELATWYHEAPYGVYGLRDAFIAISISTPAAIGRALDSPRIAAFQGRDSYALRGDYARALAEELAGRSLAEIEEAFGREGIWYQRVQTYDDLRADPQAVHNEVFLEVPVGPGTATLINHPVRYDGKGAEIRVLATRLGEHSREVLAELGYDEATIERYARAGIIVAGDHP